MSAHRNSDSDSEDDVICVGTFGAPDFLRPGESDHPISSEQVSVKTEVLTLTPSPPHDHDGDDDYDHDDQDHGTPEPDEDLPDLHEDEYLWINDDEFLNSLCSSSPSPPNLEETPDTMETGNTYSQSPGPDVEKTPPDIMETGTTCIHSQSPGPDVEKTPPDTVETGTTYSHCQSPEPDVEETPDAMETGNTYSHSQSPGPDVEKTLPDTVETGTTYIHSQSPGPDVEKTPPDTVETGNTQSHSQSPGPDVEKTPPDTMETGNTYSHSQSPGPDVEKTPSDTMETGNTYSHSQSPEAVASPNPVPKPRSRSMDEFFIEMKNKIIAIINEASMLGMGARDYHPFYLEMLKYITEGQELGYIGMEDDDVQDIWIEYDDLIQLLEDRTLYLEEHELSPYALYIQKGEVYNKNGDRVEMQRNEEELEKRFMELATIAGRISSRWGKALGQGDTEDDLKARLEFLCECQTMTNPADVIRMNDLWKKFREDCKSSSSISTEVFVFTSENDVPQSFQCSVRIEDIAKDRKWGCKVRRLLLQRKLSLLKSTSGPPSERTMSPPRRKRKAERETSSSSRSRTSSRSKKSPKPKKRKLKRLKKVQLSKEESVKLVKKKLQEKELKKYKRSWAKIKMSLSKICERRRHWERLRIQRSEKVAMTLEKVVISSCRLRTLKNRKEWMWMKLKKVEYNSEDEISLTCHYCDKLWKTKQSKMIHMARSHPKEYAEIKAVKAKIRNAKKRDKRRALVETGEGPTWVKKEKNRRGGAVKTCVCEHCGLGFCNETSLRRHEATAHNSNFIRSRCPSCNETYIDGLQLWYHFQCKHLNYDLIKLCKEKSTAKGLDFDTPSKSNSGGGQQREKEELPENITKTRNEAGDEVFKCDLCGKTFERFESSSRHLKNVHGVGKEEWRCDICSKTFKAKDNRDAHVRQIHEGQNHRCDICNRKFQGKGKLWKHIVEVHKMKNLEPPEGVNVMECPYCGEIMLRGMLAHVKKEHPKDHTEYLETRKKEKSSSKGPGKTSSSREKYNKRRKEQARKWKEEGILDVPWLASRIRPKNNCPFCGMSMSEIGKWTEHLEKFCEGKKTDEEKTEAVRLRYTRNKKWACPVDGCEHKFFDGSAVTKHYLTHSTTYKNLEKEEYVTKVEKQSNSNSAFINHRYDCLVCKKNKTRIKLVSKEEVIIHFLLNHRDLYNKYKGDIDPEVGENLELVNNSSEFYTKDDSEDKKPVVSKDPTSYDCPHCSEKLSSDSDLRSHLEVSHEDKCWRCPYPGCKKVVLSPEEMQTHYSEVHKTISQV